MSKLSPTGPVTLGCDWLSCSARDGHSTNGKLCSRNIPYLVWMDIASPVVADGDEIRKFPEHVKILTCINDTRRFNKLFKAQSVIIILRHSFFRPDHSSQSLGVL